MKPWPNGLASRRKSMEVRLAFRFATHLRGLAMTCVDFGRAQIRTQVDARFSPFGHPTQVLVLQTCVDLRVRLASGLKYKRIGKKQQ